MSSRERSYGPRFSPRRRWSQVGGAAVQADLRHAFALWGLPAHIRVDNGMPWGSDDGLPPELACWLIGLGVDVLWNPPYRPQANGVVERSQGVAKQWAEPQTAPDAVELQRRLDRFDRLQRERYPHDKASRSRAELYPSLTQAGRPYDPAREAEAWQLTRVVDHLTGYVVQRKVDPQGKIRLYNNQRHVGHDHVGQLVWVSLDPLERRWVVTDEAGHEFRRVEATELTAEAVHELRMVYRSTTRPAPMTEPVLCQRPDAVPPEQQPCGTGKQAAQSDVGVGGIT